jgi:hypothetical protein
VCREEKAAGRHAKWLEFSDRVVRETHLVSQFVCLVRHVLSLQVRKIDSAHIRDECFGSEEATKVSVKHKTAIIWVFLAVFHCVSFSRLLVSGANAKELQDKCRNAYSLFYDRLGEYPVSCSTHCLSSYPP